MENNSNSFSDMLMNVKGACPNCGTTLTFMESAQLAKDNGITEDAVMCHNCQKVYTVNITLHKMNFVDEISEKKDNMIRTDNEDILSYALDFKKAIEEDDLITSKNLLNDWINEYPDDANVLYATVILKVIEGKDSLESLKVILKSADKVEAKDVSLELWYKDKANELLEKKEWEMENVDKQIKNDDKVNSEIIRPAHKSIDERKNDEMTNEESYHQPQQQIPQQPTNNYYNQADPEDKSFLALLFYKRDKKTMKYRISKTKTISILLFIFSFLLMFISVLIDPELSSDPDLLLLAILSGIIFALMLTVPTFIIGYVIAYILDRNKKPDYQENIPQQVNIPNQQYNQNRPNQQNPISIPKQEKSSISKDKEEPQKEKATLDFIPQEEEKKVESIKDNSTCKEYYEKDNLGTKHDSIEKANGYWLGERLQMDEKYPFTMYTFNSYIDAEEAFLELPYIHKAADSGEMICEKVYIYGYYMVNPNEFEAIICGKDLSIEDFELAEEAFSRHNGLLKNNLKPDNSSKNEVKESSSKANSIRFREKVNKDQFTYECYDADTKEDALDFLKQQEVSVGLYYICVYTPEGDFGRDKDGIYQM